MKTPLLSPVVAALGTLAVLVSGGVASADVVPVDKLSVIASPPASAAPSSPSDMPATIPATEHADGIFASIVPAAKRKATEDKGYRYVGVFTNDAQARAYAADGTFDINDERQSSQTACLATFGGLQPALRLLLRTKPPEPPKLTAAQIELLKKQHRWPPPPPKPPAVKPGPPKDVIQRVRLERLTRDADAVTVDTVDALFDLQTLGSRLLSKTSAKLARITTGPSGIGVFAARDDKGNTEFLVTGPELPQPPTESDRPAQLEALASAASRLIAQTALNTSASSGCGRVRFTLASKPGAGEMATLLTMAFLPPSAEPDEGPSSDDSDGDGEPDEQGFVQQQTLRRGMRKQRARPLAINVSLSQLQSEPSPLLSVTFGWAGKDEELSF
jgi:hypothetical protein